jgi:hypothetical protein
MQEFPILNAEQVAVIRAESGTGHILDDKFNLAIDDEQKVYTIFDTTKDALVFVEKELIKRQGFDLSIFDQAQNLLYYFQSIKDFNSQFRYK